MLKTSLNTPKQLGLLTLSLVIFYTWLYHAYMMVVFPDPLFEPDSTGYVSGAIQHFFGHAFEVNASRGMGYPLLLSAGLTVFRNFRGILWTQHALWMVTTVVTTAIFLKERPEKYGWAALLFFIVGCSPMGTVFSNSILTDAVYTVWQMLALGGLLGIATALPSIDGTVTGLAMLMAMQTRPTGKLLVLIVLGVFFMNRHDARYRKTALVTIFVGSLIFLLFLFFNYKTRGVVGVENFGGSFVVGESLKHLDPSDLADEKVRELLAPIYRGQFQEDMKDSTWIWYSPDGPITALRKDPSVQARIDSVYAHIFITVLLRHPIPYLKGLVHVCFIMIKDGTRNQETVPDRIVSMIFSFRTYSHMPIPFPDAWGLLSFRPENSNPYFDKLRRRALPPFDDSPSFFYPIWLLSEAYFVLSWVGLLSAGWLCIRSFRKPVVMVCCGVILCNFLMIALGGVFAPRYGIPLGPLYALLTFLALSEYTPERDKRIANHYNEITRI